MFPPAARSALRSASRSAPFFSPVTTSLGKRFASTSPANAQRSWRSSALRWGIAIGGIYYYNTSPVFAEQPQHNLLNPNLDALDDEHRDHATLEALTSARARQGEQNAQILHSAANSLSSENASTTVVAEHEIPMGTGVEGLEEEAASQGAFNPETGEINWDCPCLGGMADGPCGPEFREAFSCFVFSEQEPKGMDCIDKFQKMQHCFQQHPEVYKGELEDDEELSAGMEEERQELVNEIAERKKQQSESDTHQRLLEEPDPVPRATRASTKTALQKSQPQTQSHSEGEKGSQQSNSHAPSQPQSLPSATFDATAADEQSNKQPSEEGKIKASNEATHESNFSPEREDISEGGKSDVKSRPKKSSPASGDQTTSAQSEIIPRAAFNATSSSSSQE